MSTTTSEVDYLQELAQRHDEMMQELDKLEEKIEGILGGYLDKITQVSEKIEKIQLFEEEK